MIEALGGRLFVLREPWKVVRESENPKLSWREFQLVGTAVISCAKQATTVAIGRG